MPTGTHTSTLTDWHPSGRASTDGVELDQFAFGGLSPLDLAPAVVEQPRTGKAAFVRINRTGFLNHRNGLFHQAFGFFLLEGPLRVDGGSVWLGNTLRPQSSCQPQP